MSAICIPIPDLHKHTTVGLEVTIDGQRRVMNYRVESFNWSTGNNSGERIDRLRSFVADYDRSWELVQIGRPDGDVVSITFRQHVSTT